MHPMVGLRRFGPIVAMLASMLFGTPASAQTKVALVIGNSAYRSVPALPNPAHDAADVAASFERLGFSVRQVTDATYDDMRRALLEFGRKANNAEMAVVFFAGHGMEVGGENWLIPIDAELKIDVNAEQEAIALRSVMLTVSSASKLGMVMLDACRNNPFLARMNRTVLTRSVDRGLARIEPVSNVLVAYASKEGTVAADGGGRNSPFTSALLEHLEAPGLEINFLFRNVHDEVVAATRGAQQPFVYGSLSKEAIYLKPPAAASALPGPDEVAWGFLKETTDDAALRRFTEQYPNSPLRPQAQARIKALATAQAAKPVPPSPDEVTWAILKETTDEAALKRFVAQYPNSIFRQQAEVRMAALAAEPAGKPQLSRTSVSSPTSADFYTFTSALTSDDSRWCIDIPGSEYQPGKLLSLFGCGGTPNQIFGFANRSNLTAGGLCLDGRSPDRGKPPGAGDPVVIAECDGSDHQVWELEPFDNDPSSILVVAPSGLCVTVDGANAGPRTPLMLAQCDDLKSQAWIPGDMARPARPRAQESASRSGYAEFAEAEYYWFEGHRYCWYDGGWRGPGWYWCGYSLNKGAGWGGPIGWHFWYHFGHRILNHPVFFAAHHGKPEHEHMAAGTGTGKGGKDESGNKRDKRGKDEAHESGKGGKGGRDNQPSTSAMKEGTHKGNTDHKGSTDHKGNTDKSGQNGQTGGGQGNLAGKEKIIARGNQNGGNSNQGNSHGGGGGHHGSDIRLKADIVPLTRLDGGIGLYRFRYRGSNHTAYVGVLAQEVMEIVPSAVSLGRNGYLQVDYDRLGLKLVTWENWLRHNGAELRPAKE
jgi:caspase domain-containing protein/ricin-type beta-trefoil lectin protein/endosialidase-like protein